MGHIGNWCKQDCNLEKQHRTHPQTNTLSTHSTLFEIRKLEGQMCYAHTYGWAWQVDKQHTGLW